MDSGLAPSGRALRDPLARPGMTMGWIANKKPRDCAAFASRIAMEWISA
jgi:hypothetical protein